MEKYIIENEILKVEISTLGAEIQSIYHKNRDIEYMWNGDKAHWARRSPILFPFIGRLKDDEAFIDDKLIKCKQHGFARNKEFEVLEKSSECIVFSLKNDHLSFQMFPYKYELLITYILKDNKLKVIWNVINRDDKIIYFSIGGHPAFNVPFVKGTSVSDYYFEFEKNENLKRYYLTPPLLKNFEIIEDIEVKMLKADLFKNDALVYSGVDAISIKNIVDKTNIRVDFTGFPFVGIWSPYHIDGTIAPFICIEPWYGIADSFESTKIFREKLGIIELDKSSDFKANYIIEIN